MVRWHITAHRYHKFDRLVFHWRCAVALWITSSWMIEPSMSAIIHYFFIVCAWTGHTRLWIGLSTGRGLFVDTCTQDKFIKITNLVNNSVHQMNNCDHSSRSLCSTVFVLKLFWLWLWSWSVLTMQNFIKIFVYFFRTPDSFSRDDELSCSHAEIWIPLMDYNNALTGIAQQ